MNQLIVKQKYTGKKLATLNLHNSSDVDTMLQNATNLHKKGRLPSYQRIEILQKLAILMQQEQQSLAELIANEGGKPLKDAKIEVTRAIDGVFIAIASIRNIQGSEIPMDLTKASVNRLAFTTMEAIGVVVAISAFNHPLNLTIHQVVPAIATGCPIIIKPANTTPLSCLRFAELAKQAGLPLHWLQVAILEKENAEKLITDKRVKFFSFIGSAKVGWMLRSKLAPGVRCALEHGGVAPLILDNYQKIDDFINGVIKAGFYHAGQVCVSVQKVFIPENNIQNITNKIVNATKQLIVNDAINANTDIGPLISDIKLNRIEKWVNDAIAEGATLLTGGKKINSVCYEPTILLNPNKNSKVSTMEIFGPVICIYTYKNINDAINIANSLDVSFQASIFSDNITTAINTANALEASAVMINDYTTFRTDWMPFAGRKNSGYGIGGIPHTMNDMLEHKMFVIKY